MLIGEGIFLLPFVVTRVFRPTFLKVFDITNFELGSAFSLYGIVAMVAYFLGGPLADRYSPKKLLITSLLATAAAGVVMAWIPSLTILTLLYGFWGCSTILLFWAGYIKAIRHFGGEDTQGRSHGVVDGGRGLVAAIVASGSVFLLDWFMPVSAADATKAELSSALSGIIYSFSLFVIFSALLVYVVLPSEKTPLSDNITLRHLRKVMKKRVIWLQAIIVLCSYVGYKCTDDFGLYAQVVFGYDDVNAAHLATISFWVRPFATIGAGLLGDRLGHSKMVIWCFVTMIIGSSIIAAGVLQVGMLVMIALTIATVSAGIYGLRGLYYALFQESRIPLSITGSAVGFIAVFGYTPDVFMGPLMGYLLDNFPGVLGHQLLFMVLIGFSLVGLYAAIEFKRFAQKKSS